MVVLVGLLDGVFQRLGKRALKLVAKLIAATAEKCLVVNEIKELGSIQVAPKNVGAFQLAMKPGLSCTPPLTGVRSFVLP